MMLQWMVYATVSAALVGAAAECVERAAVRGTAIRRWVWAAAILVSVGLPVALPVVRPPHETANPAAATPASVLVEVVDVEKASSLQWLDIALLAGWVATSLAFIALLAAAYRRNQRLLDSCRSAFIDGCPVLVSDDFGPALVGAFRPRIVVPGWSLGLEPNEQRLVVLHEREHARSGDPMLGLAGVIALALMPWNPALWWQLARLRLAIELDCDARVVHRQHDGAIAYSRLLLHVRERDRTRQPVLALSHARSSLAKRLDALLVGRRSSVRYTVGAATFGTCLLAAVGFVPVPRVAAVFSTMRLRDNTPRARVTESATRAEVAGTAAVLSSAASRATVNPRRSVTIGYAIADGRISAVRPAVIPPIRVVPSNPLSGMTVEPSRPPIELPRIRAGFAIVRQRTAGSDSVTLGARATAGSGVAGGGFMVTGARASVVPGSGVPATDAPASAVAGTVRAVGRFVPGIAAHAVAPTVRDSTGSVIVRGTSRPTPVIRPGSTTRPPT